MPDRTSCLWRMYRCWQCWWRHWYRQWTGVSISISIVVRIRRIRSGWWKHGISWRWQWSDWFMQIRQFSREQLCKVLKQLAIPFFRYFSFSCDRPRIDSIDFFANTLDIRKDAIQPYENYNPQEEEDIISVDLGGSNEIRVEVHSFFSFQGLIPTCDLCVLSWLKWEGVKVIACNNV